MAAPRRYYPGFFGASFLVLLRLAIGWHFLYEGTQKILSTPEGKNSFLARYLPVPEGPAFSSEGYLRNATGPLAARFRALIPDVDGRDRLDPERLKDRWTREADRISSHFGFTDTPPADAKEEEAKSPVVARPKPSQKAAAAAILDDRKKVADDWFQSVENREKVRKYLDELAEIEAIEDNPKALDYERENARRDRKSADADRKELLPVVDAWSATLRDALVNLATPDQVKAHGPYTPPLDSLKVVDLMTMYGLTAIGLSLMLGLFTPIGALAGATFLTNIYLSNPPFPGLPDVGTGHYRYVNIYLIELLSCLVLASTPSGLWVGIDAVLFGWIGRGRRSRDLAEAAESGRPPSRPEPQDRRKFKNR